MFANQGSHGDASSSFRTATTGKSQPDAEIAALSVCL